MLEGNSLTTLLASFFYERRYVSIPRLGSFQLSPDASPDVERHHKDMLRKGSIFFSPDIHEKVDPELITYITERTRKMETLAISDLISLADQAREMLNMGQSYTFASLATLVPMQGHFEVVPDHFPPQASMHKGAGRGSFRQGDTKKIREAGVHSGGGKSLGGVIMVGICVVIMAALVYFLFFHRGAPREQPPSPREATLTPVTKAQDKDTAVSTSQNGALHYEVVFEEASRDRALQRYRQLTSWGHPIILRTADSTTFTLAVPFTTLPRDTTSSKDSIATLYGHPVYIRF